MTYDDIIDQLWCHLISVKRCVDKQRICVPKLLTSGQAAKIKAQKIEGGVKDPTPHPLMASRDNLCKGTLKTVCTLNRHRCNSSTKCLFNRSSKRVLGHWLPAKLFLMTMTTKKIHSISWSVATCQSLLN